MITKIIGVQGSIFPENQEAHFLLNKSGAPTVVGGLYQLDLARSATTSVDYRTATSTVIAINAAAVTGTGRVYAVALDVVADGVRGRFAIGDLAIVDLLVDGTAAVVAGDPLKPVSASPNSVKATVATDRIHAIALEPVASGTKLIKAQIFPTLRPI